jgi:drug/metabolite transporter (DMT)-like permease
VAVIQESVCEPRPRAPRRPAWLDRESAPALLVALVTVVLWASAFVGIRSAGRDLSPGSLALGRLLMASAVLLLSAAIRRELVPRNASDVRAAAPALILCGLLWFGAYNVALNAAERRVDAGTAAMLIGIGPILIAIVAGFALREGFPRGLLAGCAIAFGGVLVIGIASSNGGSTTTGIVLCLAAAGAYAVAVVSQKSVIGRLTPLQTTLICCFVATGACLPLAPQLARDLGDSRAGAIGWVLYLGAFPTAIAFTTWAFALARTSAGKLGATTYLAPPISVLLGWLLLSESPPALALAGGALCLAGVAIARRG